jgi:hypothetical protein
MKTPTIWTTVFIIGLSACGGEDDRQEVLNKLRAIGAAANPLVSKPSLPNATPGTVELTVYATLPLGEVATIEPFMDEPSTTAITLIPEQIAVQTDSIEYQAYPHFQMMTFKALLTVPSATQFPTGAGQVRYGISIKSGSEEEKVIGAFLVFPEDSPELNWTHPNIDSVTPTDGDQVAKDSEVEISAATSTNVDEELKIGWFVSNGEIRSRRAKKTKWETPAAGEQTLIFTARGRKSRGFAIKVMNIRTE